MFSIMFVELLQLFFGLKKSSTDQVRSELDGSGIAKQSGATGQGSQLFWTAENISALYPQEISSYFCLIYIQCQHSEPTQETVCPI